MLEDIVKILSIIAISGFFGGLLGSTIMLCLIKIYESEKIEKKKGKKENESH